MMLNAFKKVIIQLATGANVVTVLLLWACAASVYVNPSFSALLGILGLAFPGFLLANLFFLVFWGLFSWKHLWIPVVGFVACAGSIRTYIPLNVPSPHPKGSIKVLSYNVLAFGEGLKNEKGENVVAAYMKSSDADIICFQEGATGKDVWHKEVLGKLSKRLPYHDTIRVGTMGNVLGCISHFPIVGKERITYDSKTNGSVVYKLLLARNDTLLVVNNHFESNKLTMEDRALYKQMIKQPKQAPLERNSRFLLSKVGHAGAVRASQVDSVVAYLLRHTTNSIILCGDFNDSPISYTHNRIAEHLNDAYVKTGNGPGYSFNRDGIFVRIDNLFCSNDWQPYGCKVDKTILASDHYPIYGYFKRK